MEGVKDILAEDLQVYLHLDGIYLSFEQAQGLASCLLQDPEWIIERAEGAE